MRASTRRALRPTALFLPAALFLAGCGEADATASEPAASAADDPAADGAVDGQDAGDRGDPTDDPPADLAPAEELAAEDGWNGLHDGVDLPPPGEGVLVVDGERIELDVTCSGGGPLATLGGAAIFAFQARGDGVDAQGREMYVEVARRLVSAEEGARTVYEYEGQEHGSIQIVVATGDDRSPYHSSIVVSPADDDRTGSKLPIVRVEESGRFTVVEDDVPPLHATIHGEALHGSVELAGACPDGWPEDD
jgi:hypothetical protein